jgi:hypothetical protein
MSAWTDESFLGWSNNQEFAMETLNEYATTEKSDTFTSASSFLGRRRGDAVLLAWKFARERGDMDVADQLMLEYEIIIDAAHRPSIGDRRRKSGNMHCALRGLWQWLLRGQSDSH